MAYEGFTIDDDTGRTVADAALFEDGTAIVHLRGSSPERRLVPLDGSWVGLAPLAARAAAFGCRVVFPPERPQAAYPGTHNPYTAPYYVLPLPAPE